jgi:S-phase kinase-associated protein 1
MSIILKTCDNVEFIVPRNIAVMSLLIADMISDEESEDIDHIIPLINIDAKILTSVLEFLVYNISNPFEKVQPPITTNNMRDIVDEWYSIYTDLEKPELFKNLMAADYLNIPTLLDLLIIKVATTIVNKTKYDVASQYVVSDLASEEEEMFLNNETWI